MSESKLQSQCFQYAWNTYPASRLMLFHVPNGGRRSKIEAMQFKAMGVIPGVADMIFIHKGKVYAFEFKTGTGIQSPAQKEWEKKYENFNTSIHNDKPLLIFKYRLSISKDLYKWNRNKNSLFQPFSLV